MKIVIIGGVAIGATLAAKLRRLDENVEIEVFEKSNHISYANCGLPYYLSRTIPTKEELVLQKPENFANRYNLSVHVQANVTDVDFENKQITYIKDNQTKTSGYDKLVIGTGASAINLPFLSDLPNTFVLKNVEDTLKIDEYISENNVKNVAVLGSGSIGIEASENFAKRGLNTTIVEMQDQILPLYDKEIAHYAKEELIHEGINVVTSDGATSFDQKNNELVLQSGKRVKAELILSAVGVRPNSGFLKDTELSIDERGFINTNQSFETNIKDVYAAGDVIKPMNKFTKDFMPLQLANPANQQAVMLAKIILGQKITYKPYIGTSIVKLMDTTLAQTGLSQKAAEKLGLDFTVINAHLNNHAGYYPNAGLLHLKVLINDKTGQIYGAQGATTVTGLDKRIDLLAFAIKKDIPIQDLIELETTYAPQFGSAKDPIIMLGYIGNNIVNDDIKLVQYQDLTAEEKQNILFVVEPNEVSQIKLPNVFNIPLDELRSSLDKLDKNVEYIVSCKAGMRAHLAVNILRQNGFKVKNLSGGYLSINQWIEAKEG